MHAIRSCPPYRLTPLLLVAALLLTGCNVLSSPEADKAPGTTPSTPTGSRPTLRMPPAPDGLQRFYEQEVTWRPCSDGFECADVRVPLDYAEPDGDTIALSVSRRPADEPDQRIGAMLVNPGGPGVPGISYAPVAAQQFRSDVLNRYDIIGFNPRGVASSAGVDCLSDAGLDAFVALDPTPDGRAAVTAAKRALGRFGRGCVQGPGDVAAHVSTPEAARDMDVIRAVVDSTRLHYYGASYGTLLGATYAELFPERVGRMVLDGAVDPSLTPTQQSLQQAIGFQKALDAYLENCVEQGDCPLGDSVPEAERRLNAFLAEVDDDALPAPGARDLTVGHAVLGVWLPLYVPELWPMLTIALDRALAGEGGQLMRLADLYISRGPSGYQDNSIEALYAVNCLDHPGGQSVQEVRRLLPRFTRVSPVFGDVFAWGLIGCPGWPVEAAEKIPEIDAQGASPIVVIGTTGDPATPYRSAVALADQLASGVLVTRVGEGHTGFARGNECVDAAVNDFFANGKVPEDGLRCS